MASVGAKVEAAKAMYILGKLVPIQAEIVSYVHPCLLARDTTVILSVVHHLHINATSVYTGVSVACNFPSICSKF